MGLSLQLTKALMNRGTVRACVVLLALPPFTAHKFVVSDMLHVSPLPNRNFQKETSEWCGSCYFYVLFLDIHVEVYLYVRVCIRC